MLGKIFSITGKLSFAPSIKVSYIEILFFKPTKIMIIISNGISKYEIYSKKFIISPPTVKKSQKMNI